MTGEQWRDERMLEWLESGPSEVPTEPLEAAVAYARAHPRRWLSVVGLRRFVMSQMHLQEVQPSPAPRRWGAAFAAIAVVVVAVAVIGGVGLLSNNGNDNAGGVVAPVASPTAPAAVPPTLAPTGAPTQAPPSAASACVVSTLAGKPLEPGFADGAGSAARFGEEGVGLVFGPDGLIYMPDRANHVIRRMTTDGVVNTIAGKAGDARSVDGKGADARFNRPSGGGFDAAGNFYVADTDAHTIRKIAPDGTVTTIAGKAGETGEIDGKGSAARFKGPIVGSVDGSGNVYVGAVFGHTIRKVAPDGTVTTIAGKAGETGTADGNGSAARFNNPWFVVVGAQGVLWVVDANGDGSYVALRKVTPDGTVTTVKSKWTYGAPFGLWPEPSGAIYYTAYLDSTVAMLTPEGQEVLLAGKVQRAGGVSGSGEVARFYHPTGIVRDASGLIYVSDSSSGMIRTIRCAVGGGFPAGTWSRPLPSGMTGVMDFRPDGTWTYTRDGEVMSAGTYSTDAGTLTFHADSGCSEQNADRGTYAWTYANDQLMFTRLDDQCLVGRVTTFDGSTWTPVR